MNSKKWMKHRYGMYLIICVFALIFGYLNCIFKKDCIFKSNEKDELLEHIVIKKVEKEID